MNKLTDTDRMKFGKFNGIKMANVPYSWLIEFWNENKTKYNVGGLDDQNTELMVYIEDRFEDLP